MRALYCRLNITHEFEKDFFTGIYDSPKLTMAMVMTYILCTFCMVGIGYVIWFERSGQAGHFRTLVNQLSTFNLDQVILYIHTKILFFAQQPKKVVIKFWSFLSYLILQLSKFLMIHSSELRRNSLMKCFKLQNFSDFHYIFPLINDLVSVNIDQDIN